MYKNGMVVLNDQWTEDGTKHAKNIQFDSLQNVYQSKQGETLNGMKFLSGTTVYFSEGKVDSVNYKDIDKVVGGV
jgi:hypothetical protein|tara:strand:- start:6263 stop:6487 length:225 start_codon:yes stop_codon:yes gene_type:complete